MKMAPKLSKIDAPDAPETAPSLQKTTEIPQKLQNFSSVNAKKGRNLVKIVLPVEIEGNKQIVSHLHTSMTLTFSKNGQIGSKIAKNRKKLGMYPTLTLYCGSYNIFGL